jgi:16S rRNA (cytosine967-C5)-methyltransferase
VVLTQSRKVVWNILSAVRRGRRLDRSFEEETTVLVQKDKAWCREMAYGIQRFRGRIDYLLHPNIRRGFDSVDPAVKDVLRIGLYETLYMHGVPQYAAVSQAVELAKKVGKSATGFVNAVLRSAANKDGGQENFPDKRADPVAYLSTWGSHPTWLVKRWLSRWSVEEVCHLVDANNQVPPIFLNCLQSDPDEAVARLKRFGITAEEVEGTSCIMLKTSGSLGKAMTVIPSMVQDPAAALVPAYMDIGVADRIVDFCAAPGGKTMALAAKGHFVLAVDRSFNRLELLGDNLQRLKESESANVSFEVHIVQGDVYQPVIAESGAILVDVPCTGTGTLRRNPDIRWKITEENLNEMVCRQTKILDSMVKLVPIGGILVYSTCSLELEENNHQIERFLRTYSCFQLEPGKGVDSRYLDSKGQLSVVPQIFGFDGSFAARMRRIS